ncbi:WD40-repeat-containing domain protein [Rhexocercosporidium sp. MPI-PUGE-AT-0058]|nr:WD40-repeat-containing domain protein [Rhexocercosporidium sp. MPI-PUGE-AT-0058]
MSVQNPLTPPNDASSEAGAFDSGVTSTSILNPYSNYGALGTPASMGIDSPEDRADGDERGPHSSSDEDQDMSDGGAALTMTLSHAEALNNEMDMLDAELMGHHNMLDISGLDPYPPASYFTEPSVNDPPSLWTTMDEAQHTQPFPMPTNVPPAMSEVSQVLQHLQDGQDGQEHAEIADETDEIHGANLQHSTPSILLPFFQNFPNGGVGVGGILPNFVSMAQIAPANLPTEPWTNPSQVLPAAQAQNTIASHVPVVEVDDMSDADQPEVEDQFNLTLANFLHSWGTSSASSSRSTEIRHRARGPSLASLREQRLERPKPIERSDLQGERCDIQRINWEDLGVSRVMARQQRRATYRNYTNLRVDRQWHPRLNGARLEDDQNFFRFRRMDFNHNVNLAHFQLRNLMACASRDHIFYAGRAQVLHWNPHSGSSQADVAMDLTNPTVQPGHWMAGSLQGIQVSTLTVNHDILVAGGFSGEYALVNLKAQKDTSHTEGLVTEHANSITNHIQLHLSPNSNAPVVAFASNDNYMRVLDVGTNTFISSHQYEHAINCTAISPDQRLRVLVGDTRQVMICNSETGDILQSLDGHRDFGFSCDWADDGWTVATGNQDMQVKIWDARKWTDSSGLAQCVATVAADMAGVRKLKFSPLGSGKRVLLAAEPADIISVIDGESFTSKQTLSFFGEIGGVDFTNDGQDIFVANCDDMRGGLMQFERCGLATHGLYGLEDYNPRRKSRSLRRGQGHDWKQTDEEVVKHPRAKGTEEQRYRRAAKLGVAMGFF